MKRYIEIIFDNSASMLSQIANKPKHEHAKQIFKDVVLPFLDFTTDDVAFRLLRNGCDSVSKANKMADSKELAQKVYGVDNYDNNTPLFHTIRDSIETCQQNAGSYDKMLIFALTDGEDNCDDYMEEVFNQLELKKLGIELDMLLVQFAVDSEIQTNNLNAFSQFLGAQTIQVNGNQLVDYKLAKTRLNKALAKSVLNNSYLLPHCFDASLKGTTFTWDEIELQGYLRYWAGMLFREGLIQWNPTEINSLKEFEYREFKFLCALRFKSGFPSELMKRMFLQLSAPYYYCLDEMYWDFADAKWKFFPTIPKVEPVINPDRYKEIDDNPLSMQNNKFSSNIASRNNQRDPLEKYREGYCYTVIRNDEDILTFSLKHGDCSKNMKTLNEGDIIRFTEKRHPGRPRKTQY